MLKELSNGDKEFLNSLLSEVLRDSIQNEELLKQSMEVISKEINKPYFKEMIIDLFNSNIASDLTPDLTKLLGKYYSDAVLYKILNLAMSCISVSPLRKNKRVKQACKEPLTNSSVEKSLTEEASTYGTVIDIKSPIDFDAMMETFSNAQPHFDKFMEIPNFYEYSLMVGLKDHFKTISPDNYWKDLIEIFKYLYTQLDDYLYVDLDFTFENKKQIENSINYYQKMLLTKLP